MNLKEKLAVAVSALSIANNVRTWSKEAKVFYDERYLYTARVGSEAYVYPKLMEWLNEQTKPKTIKFNSTHSNGVKAYYDGSGITKVNVGGHTLGVQLEKPNLNNGVMLSDFEDLNTFMNGKIVFIGRTASAIEALQKFLEEMTEDLKRAQRDVFIWTPSGTFWNNTKMPERPLDSVFLPEGVKENFTHDLDTFFDNEDHYRRIGVPWHRGYLFYGPPGNGKSSLALATASEYKMHLYNLPLSSLKSDRELGDKIASISPHSILLLEDIDIFSKSMSREQADSGPTLAGLLNALDGVSTPHGLLTFMTTNRIDVLDEALIRPGRIDQRIEFNAPIDCQVEQMFLRAYDEPLGVPPRKFGSMAEAVDILKRHTLDAEAARMEIKAG